jgi:uncharacterized protein (TIGR02271 family)
MNVVDKNGLQGHIIQEVSLLPNSDKWMLIQFDNGQFVLAPPQLLSPRDDGGDDGGFNLAARAEELLAKKAGISPHPELKNASRDDQDRNALAGASGPTESHIVIPVVEERIQVEGRKFETATVKIHKRVEEQTEMVDPPLQSQEVEIDRVAVNRIVDEAIPVRFEGDTTIIPLLEEVLVVEKRLLLREEVHIRKVHKEVHTPQEVLLRKETVEIERVPQPETPAKGSQRKDSAQ